MSMRSLSTPTLPILTVGSVVAACPPRCRRSSPPRRSKSPGKWSVPRTPWGRSRPAGQLQQQGRERHARSSGPTDLAGKSLSDFGEKELAELRKTRQARAQAGAGRIGGSEEEDTGAGPSHWYEHLNASNSQAWFVFEPADGKIPPLTKEARDRAAARQAARRGRGPADSWTDRSLYDRCITRGIPGSMMPAIYGNAYDITQGPGFVAIRYEMIHETRIIPLGNSPAPAGLVPALRRRRPRTLGRRHAGGRDHQLQRRRRRTAARAGT